MQHLVLTVLTVTSALAVGMVMALLGNLKLALARRPEYAETRVRGLLILLNTLLIPLMLGAGLLVDQVGVRAMMIAGSVLLALGFLAFSASLPYERTLVAVLACAAGASALHVATIVQLPVGIFGVSEIAASLQMGLIFIALGGLLAPPLLDLLLIVVGFQRAMAMLALLFLVPAFLAAAAQGEQMFPAAEGLGRVIPMLTDPNILAAGLVFAAYAPLEAFISVWTVAYLDNHGEARFQKRWLGWFWLAVILSRLVCAVTLHAFDLRNTYLAPFLVIPAILAAVILGNLSGSTRLTFARGGLFLLGCFLGPVYPMLLGILFTRHEVESVHGSAFGLLFACGSLGSLILSPLVHYSANHRNVQAALRIPLFVALALSAMTLIFALLPRG